MKRTSAISRVFRARSFIARLAILVLVLQALIPGVLAYSAGLDGVWCRSLAAADTGSPFPSAGAEPCLVCVLMCSGNAPLPAAAMVLPAPPAVAGAFFPSLGAMAGPRRANDHNHPIRAPPRAEGLPASGRSPVLMGVPSPDAA